MDGVKSCKVLGTAVSEIHVETIVLHHLGHMFDFRFKECVCEHYVTILRAAPLEALMV
jgi:hypothetical protein